MCEKMETMWQRVKETESVWAREKHDKTQTLSLLTGELRVIYRPQNPKEKKMHTVKVKSALAPSLTQADPKLTQTIFLA